MNIKKVLKPQLLFFLIQFKTKFMINVIIDYPNIFYRATFLTSNYGKNKYTFDNQKEVDQLMRKVATDVTAILRTTNPSRTIFTLDSKSWRKEIEIEENEGYKGNRKKSEFINWDNIYKTMDEFAQILKNNNFIVSKIDKAEADDLIALWSDKILNNLNEHIIIVSGDEDIRQLVQSLNINDKKIFVTVYNPFMMGKNATKKLFVSLDFEKWLNDDTDPGDFFNRAVDTDKEDFKRLLNERIKLEPIIGSEIALRKIFCGDDGDNIPAIHTWLKENKHDIVKKVRVTESIYAKIKTALNFKYYTDLLDNSTQLIIANYLSELAKTPISFKIDERINRQLKLVVLSKELFPKDIVSDFNKHADESLQNPNIPPIQGWNMVTLLDGTKYVNASKPYIKESDIFNNIDQLFNKELF
jgi:hypothetical protein